MRVSHSYYYLKYIYYGCGLWVKIINLKNAYLSLCFKQCNILHTFLHIFCIPNLPFIKTGCYDNLILFWHLKYHAYFFSFEEIPLPTLTFFNPNNKLEKYTVTSMPRTARQPFGVRSSSIITCNAIWID